VSYQTVTQLSAELVPLHTETPPHEDEDIQIAVPELELVALSQIAIVQVPHPQLFFQRVIILLNQAEVIFHQSLESQLEPFQK